VIARVGAILNAPKIDIKETDELLQNINKSIQETTDPVKLVHIQQMLKQLEIPHIGDPDATARFKQITDQMIKDITTALDNKVSNAHPTDESKQVLNAPLTDRQLKAKEMLELVEQSNKVLNEDSAATQLQNEVMLSRIERTKQFLNARGKQVSPTTDGGDDDTKAKKSSSVKKASPAKKTKSAKKVASSKTAKSDNDDSGGDSDGSTETRVTTEDLQGLNILTRIATDKSGTMLKDKRGNIIWDKYLTSNSPNRTYIIQTKIKNKWELVPARGVSIPFHSFIDVSKITKYIDNTIFNKVGDSVIHGNFRVTLWTKELRFSDKHYYAA